MNPTEAERFNNLSPLHKALFKIEKYKEELNSLKTEQKGGDIAIIGVALDFPNASSPEEFWQNLMEKKDSVTSFPAQRKEQLKKYYESKGIDFKSVEFQEGAYLKNIDGFDQDLFKFAPSTAITTHPLQRLFLQTSWKALEDSGGLHPNNKHIGVFFGASGDITYSQYIDIIEQSDQMLTSASLTGNTNSITSSRLSYFMDLKGPAVTIDTACSSSLVAVHQACNSILNGDSKIAIAGGGKLYLLPEKNKYHVGFESPTGRTKPFDIASDGAGVGEGIAAIVLKKLDDAIEDNDKIYAVIKGTAINQDGTSSGVIAPNPKAQTSVIKEATQKARIDINTISYIETHGTGTPLGDPIEFQGLQDAFEETSEKQFCALGAVKSNIGHLFEAAGIAGLIKCVLALQNKMIPPSIHHNEPNSNIDFKNSPFYFNTEAKEWNVEQIRRCGVSSFGISGTNAHVILEEFTNLEKNKVKEEAISLFTLSAHKKDVLHQIIQKHYNWIAEKEEEHSLSTICYAVNKANAMYNWRFAVNVTSVSELKLALANPEEYINKIEFSYKINENLIDKSITSNTEDKYQETILENYNDGGIIPWKTYYKDRKYENLKIPKYPLHPISCWPKFDNVSEILKDNRKLKEEIEVEKTSERLNYYKVYSQLSKMILADTGISLTEEMSEEDLFDFGIDSIIILQFIQTIKKQYGVVLEMGQFYDLVNTLGKLTNHIVEQGTIKKNISTKDKNDNSYKKKTNIDYFVPYKEIVKESKKGYTEKQSKHLQELTNTIVDQTSTTKKVTQEYRTLLANNRNVAGFKPETKEITYQIIAEYAKGSKIYDLDNNEYVDLTMGFGVNLLGYNPEFIEKALQEELKKGFAVGPMNKTACKVASLIHELTGNERVAFYNSGSEAVMVALRLARATTGRSKYVIFKESYHGTFDGVLALSNPLDLENSIPLAPGITDNFINNTIVLEYGTKEALAYIEENVQQLAAVLIEPVQSRRPDLQPSEFIKEVRKITKLNGTALIFDEVITGFRINLGGARKWFDVVPDLCTYGKIVGGGMPVGIVAGNAEFMDGVDGGNWQFGDDSFPNKPTTFVAGTFNQHPLTMRASYEILSYLKSQGNQLQENLNHKTTVLVNRINEYFISIGAQAKAVNFGSLFRFVFQGGWDLFYQHLLANKVYVWEGRNCFLSTAHTDKDIEFVYQAVVTSADAVMQSGWIKSENKKNNSLTIIPYTEEQEQLYNVTAVSEEASSSFNENQIVDLKGNLEINHLEVAFKKLLNRHQSLRCVKMNEKGFHIINEVSSKINSITKEEVKGEDYNAFLANKGAVPFNLNEGPFVRMHLIEVAKNHHKVLLTTHHLIADGYSIELIWNELSKIYASEKNGIALGLLPSTKLGEFNNWLEKSSKEETLATDYWKNEFTKQYPTIKLPSENISNSQKTRKGAMLSKVIEKEVKEDLQVFSRQTKSTVFNTLFTAYTILLQRLSGQNNFVVGVPASGQLAMGEKYLVGQCVKMLPIYIEINEEDNIQEYLSQIKVSISNAVQYQQCSFKELLKANDNLSTPRITTEVDMNSVKNNMNFEDLETTFTFPSVDYAKYDLSVSIIEMNDEISIDYYYNKQLFNKETIEDWGENYLCILKDIIKNSDISIEEISMESNKELDTFSTWNNL